VTPKRSPTSTSAATDTPTLTEASTAAPSATATPTPTLTSAPTGTATAVPVVTQTPLGVAASASAVSLTAGGWTEGKAPGGGLALGEIVAVAIVAAGVILAGQWLRSPGRPVRAPAQGIHPAEAAKHFSIQRSTSPLEPSPELPSAAAQGEQGSEDKPTEEAASARSAKKDLPVSTTTPGVEPEPVLEDIEREDTPHSAGERVLIAEPQLPFLHIYGLGHGRVVVGEQEVTRSNWRSISARDLFFYLVCEGPASKEQLSNTFWPNLPSKKVRNSFHTTLLRARRALAPLGKAAVRYEDGFYLFDRILNYSFDVEMFERLLDRAEALVATDPSQAVELYASAMHLYQGDFLEDYASPGQWHTIRASELLGEYLMASESLGHLLLQQRQCRAALEVYKSAIGRDPCRESAWRGLMRSLVGLGRRAEALRSYSELRQLLKTELGVSPMPDTERLYERIRNLRS
jgi:DNA-binding SARP family transcriptional activator